MKTFDEIYTDWFSKETFTDMEFFNSKVLFSEKELEKAFYAGFELGKQFIRNNTNKGVQFDID